MDFGIGTKVKTLTAFRSKTGLIVPKGSVGMVSLAETNSKGIEVYMVRVTINGKKQDIVCARKEIKKVGLFG